MCNAKYIVSNMRLNCWTISHPNNSFYSYVERGFQLKSFKIANKEQREMYTLYIYIITQICRIYDITVYNKMK